MAAHGTVKGADGIWRQIKREADLLTDRELGALAPREKLFEAADRDDLYVAVLPAGTRAFRYDSGERSLRD